MKAGLRVEAGSASSGGDGGVRSKVKSEEEKAQQCK